MRNLRWCELGKVVQVIEEKEAHESISNIGQSVSCEGCASNEVPPTPDF